MYSYQYMVGKFSFTRLFETNTWLHHVFMFLKPLLLRFISLMMRFVVTRLASFTQHQSCCRVRSCRRMFISDILLLWSNTLWREPTIKYVSFYLSIFLYFIMAVSSCIQSGFVPCVLYLQIRGLQPGLNLPIGGKYNLVGNGINLGRDIYNNI